LTRGTKRRNGNDINKERETGREGERRRETERQAEYKCGGGGGKVSNL